MYLGYTVTQIPAGLQQIMSGADKSIGAHVHLYLFMHKFHDLPLPDSDFKELE